jgi:putative tryptophan/tyrosine transport system substrate-binding protein
MRRRDFITLIGTAAAISPLAAGAQQLEGPRLIGILIPFDGDEPLVKALLSAFRQRLQELGWVESRNIRFDYRFTGQDADPAMSAFGS